MAVRIEAATAQMAFLRTASGLQSIELRPVVAVFLPLGGPGALNEHGLQPGRTLAQAAAFAFARALVLSGTQPRPGDEMTGGRKAAHVAADLRNDRYRGQVADPRNRNQQFDQSGQGGLGGLGLLV